VFHDNFQHQSSLSFHTLCYVLNIDDIPSFKGEMIVRDETGVPNATRLRWAQVAHVLASGMPLLQRIDIVHDPNFNGGMAFSMRRNGHRLTLIELDVFP
jgi:hypothetical protein